MSSLVTTILVVSGVVAALALLMYVMAPGGKLRVPAIALSTLGGIGVGVAVGLALAVVFDPAPIAGLNPELIAPTSDSRSTPPDTTKDGMRPSAPSPGGPGGAGGMAGMMGGGPGGMGGRGPNPKVQLASLVVKLDQLTGKPLVIEFDDDRRAKVLEQVEGLTEPEELSDEEAQKRLDALLAIVEEHRPTLEAAGYRWPGAGGGFSMPQDTPNPFREDSNAEHLRSLREDLAAAGPGS